MTSFILISLKKLLDVAWGSNLGTVGRKKTECLVYLPKELCSLTNEISYESIYLIDLIK